MTMRRSSSLRPSLLFHRAMSAFMLTSCGIQWLAQPSRYFCQAQSYLKGTSWLRSARALIICLSPTCTRAAEPSRSSRPSWMSRSFRAFLARATASESSAETARASSTEPAASSSSLSWPWATAWAAAGAALASVGSSLSNSSQLSILLSPGLAAVSAAWIWGVRCTRKRWSGTVWPGRSSPPEGRRGLFLALARGLALPAWRWTSDRQAPGRPNPREESGLPGRDTDAVQRRAITGRLRSRGCRCCMPAAPAPASARRPGRLAGRRCHRPTRR